MNIPIERCNDSRKVQMPTKNATHAVIPLRIQAHQVVQLSCAQFLDFKFFKQVVADSDTPVW